MTKKQTLAIKEIDESFQDTSNLSEIDLKYYWLMPLGIGDIKKGTSTPEMVFLDWSEKGIKPTETSDVRRLVNLMMVHKINALFTGNTL